MKCCIMYSSEVCSGNMCLDKRALQATWASRARAKMLLHVQTRADMGRISNHEFVLRSGAFACMPSGKWVQCVHDGFTGGCMHACKSLLTSWAFSQQIDGNDFEQNL